MMMTERIYIMMMIMMDRGGIVTCIDGNYRVITPIFTKYGTLPLCLENYALFSLPKNFTDNFYTYTLSNTLYLGETSGDKISNYHGIFIHIFMHEYYPIYQKKKIQTVFFHIHA